MARLIFEWPSVLICFVLMVYRFSAIMTITMTNSSQPMKMHVLLWHHSLLVFRWKGPMRAFWFLLFVPPTHIALVCFSDFFHPRCHILLPSSFCLAPVCLDEFKALLQGAVLLIYVPTTAQWNTAFWPQMLVILVKRNRQTLTRRCMHYVNCDD